MKAIYKIKNIIIISSLFFIGIHSRVYGLSFDDIWEMAETFNKSHTHPTIEPTLFQKFLPIILIVCVLIILISIIMFINYKLKKKSNKNSNKSDK